jgi:archaellum biogenesis ATPase FlaH
MKKADGDLLIKSIESIKKADSNKELTALLEFEELPKAKVVIIDYYFNSLQKNSYRFFNAFLKILRDFETSIRFNIHPYLDKELNTNGK